MGINKLTVYDNDGVDQENIPNQFYTIHQIGKFKVDALYEIIYPFCGTVINARTATYSSQQLSEMVIVATDSMASRKAVWEQFKIQDTCKHYIEARMGAELGIVNTVSKVITPDNIPIVRKKDIDIYESFFYSDSEAAELPCTAKAIIYNILMISALIGKCAGLIINGNKAPNRIVFDMEHLHKYSLTIQ